MKKIGVSRISLLTIRLLALFGLFISACSTGTTNPITITISSTIKEYYVSNTIQFKTVVSGTSNQGVTWSASAGTISSSGLYTAPSNAGPVTITAKWNTDNSIKDSLTLNIKELKKDWHKWLGSSGSDYARAVTTDKDGNVYLAGYTNGALFGEANKGKSDAFIAKYDEDGNKLWHRWLGSSDYDDARALATDKGGNVYLAGETSGALFGETNKGNQDVFIVKYDKAGNELWHKWLGSNDDGYARALATDKDGNVYLAGKTYGALFGETNKGDRDAFIVKYDKAGKELWHKWLGSNYDDSARALATDKDGNVYLAGETSGALFGETNKGSFDALIVKYDKDGNKLWHEWLGSSGADGAKAVATDKDGNVYLAGDAGGALFGETNKGSFDVFIIKYDKDGNELWHRLMGSSGSDFATALATDKDGNVYLAGETYGALFGETNKGKSDVFIVKYDKDGNKLWHRWLGSSDYDYATAVATDKDANVYLAAYITGALFGEANKGNNGAFIVKFMQ